MNHIAKFNPYNMTREVILAVATGRKQMLANVLEVLENNLASDGARQHMLIWGPRGMGKSFFLKYLHIQFDESPIFKNSEFVLLPEEQSNISSASDLINAVLEQLDSGSTKAAFTSWEETEEQWLEAYQKLKTYCETKKKKHKQFLLVVVIENLNEFLLKIKKDKIAQSRFRYLLEKLENFTLIGASPHSKIDSDYNQRLFKAFKEFKLNPWQEEDYFRYFERRWELHQEQQGAQQTEAQKQLQLNKLKAISKFTGGSPRMAVVLTDLLLDEDVFSTANTLYGLVDDLTPFYQDLTKSIRPQSRKLFDTLIRAGENQSQSELAKILGTTQNSISKPFIWLQENGYVIGKKRSKEKSFSYYVRDRIYVLYYHRREIYHNQNYTPVWLLSDFLLTFFQGRELKERAIRSLKERPSQEAIDLAKISLLADGHVKEDLPKYEKHEDWIKHLEKSNVILPEKVKQILESIKALDDSKQEKKLSALVKELIAVFQKELNRKEQEKTFEEALDLTMLFSTKLKKLYNFSIEIEAAFLEVIPENLFESELARCYYYCGYDLNKLDKYEEAIVMHEKSIPLWKKEGNKKEQARNLRKIGENLTYLEKYEESMLYHEKALSLIEERGDQAMNLEMIAINLNKWGKYEEAISYYEKALSLREKEKNEDDQAWNLGHIGTNYFMTDKPSLAWGILNETTLSKERVIQQFGDAIIYKEKNEGTASGFKMAMEILHGLKERKKILNLSLSLSYLFADVLNMKISNDLLHDVTAEALEIFPEPESQVIIKAALHTVEYLENDKDTAYLEQLSPDEAIAVQAIVVEAEL